MKKIIFLALYFLLSQDSYAQVQDSTKKSANTATEYVKLQSDIDVLKKEIELLKLQEVKGRMVSGFKSERYTIVGMNMTTMLSRLAPFGNGIPLSGPTALMMRRYKGNRAFRFGLGLSASVNAETPNAAIRIGTERRKQLPNNFAFIRGVDFLLAVGNFNTPGFRFGDEGGAAIGADITFGLEYEFNQSVSIGTETILFGGIASDSNTNGLAVKLIPPIAIYLNLKLK